MIKCSPPDFWVLNPVGKSSSIGRITLILRKFGYPITPS